MVLLTPVKSVFHEAFHHDEQMVLRYRTQSLTEIEVIRFV